MEYPTIENFRRWLNTTKPKIDFMGLYTLVDYFKFLGGKPAKRRKYVRRKDEFGMVIYRTGYPYVHGKRFEKWYFEVWEPFYKKHSLELAKIVNIYPDRHGYPVYFTKRN